MEKFDWRFIWFFILPSIVFIIECKNFIKKDGWKEFLETALYVSAMISGTIGAFWLMISVLAIID